MFLKRRFAWLIAAAVLVAIMAAPSIALAHDGHAHAGPAVTKAAPVSSEGADARVAQISKPAFIAQTMTAAPPSDGQNAPGKCGGGCCGGIAGMACCSLVLAPTLIETPPVLNSLPFVFSHARPAHGLPPETLPKPPKSLA